MARLPQPGGDAGSWGAILNDYLGQAHNDDGTLKPIGAAGISAGAVTASAIADNTISEAKLDADLAAKVNAITPVTGPVDLAGDVTGTSDASVVSKVNGVTATGTPTAGQVLTTTASDAANWADPATDNPVTLSGDVTGSNEASVVVALNGVAVSGTPSASQVLTAFDQGNATWTDGGAVTMAGDVTGSSSDAQVRRVNGIAVSGTPAAGKVLKATSSTAALWQPDATTSSNDVIAVTGDYTASDGDVVLADCSANAITITLPAPASGAYVTVKKVDTSSRVLTVSAPDGAQVDGQSSWTSTDEQRTQQFISDGTNWFVVKVPTAVTPPDPGTGVQSRSAYEFLETIGVCAKLGDAAVYGTDTNAVKRYLSYLGARYLRTNNAGGTRTITQAKATMGTAIGDGISRKMHTQILNANTSTDATIRDAINQRLNFHINGGIITDLGTMESLNEHDNDGTGWDTDLRKIQPVLYSVVKNHSNVHIKNNLKVLSPAIIGNNLDVTANKLQNDINGNPLYQSFDYGNLHSYPGGMSHDTNFPTKAKGQFFTWSPTTDDPVPSNADSFEKRLKLYTHWITKNQRPIIITETGYHDYQWPASEPNKGHHSTPQEAGGMLMPRMLLEHFRIGISRTHLYELMDQPKKADENSSIGIIKTTPSDAPYTFTPKKWAKAVHNLTTILADNTPLASPGKLPFTFDAGTLTNTDFKFMPMLFQKSDGSFWLAIWRRVQVAERQTSHNCTNITPVPAAKPVTITFGSSITVASVKRYTVEYESDDVTPSNITLDNRAFTINVGPKVELIKVVLA